MFVDIYFTAGFLNLPGGHVVERHNVHRKWVICCPGQAQQLNTVGIMLVAKAVKCMLSVEENEVYYVLGKQTAACLKAVACFFK